MVASPWKWQLPIRETCATPSTGWPKIFGSEVGTRANVFPVVTRMAAAFVDGPSSAPAGERLMARKQASAAPARPTPNFLSAARRETDWARPLVSSSNWWFIFFLSCLSDLITSSQLLRCQPGSRALALSQARFSRGSNCLPGAHQNTQHQDGRYGRRRRYHQFVA